MPRGTACMHTHVLRMHWTWVLPARQAVLLLAVVTLLSAFRRDNCSSSGVQHRCDGLAGSTRVHEHGSTHHVCPVTLGEMQCTRSADVNHSPGSTALMSSRLLSSGCA